MKPRVFTLTNVLSVALAGAVALLVFTVYRARERWMPGDTPSAKMQQTSHTRGRASRTSTQIARDPAPREMAMPSGPSPQLPENSVTSSAPETEPTVRGEKDAVKAVNAPRELQRSSADVAPAITGGEARSVWYSGDAVPAIAVLLRQFAEFSKWPAEALPQGRGVSIGVLRDDTLRGALTLVVPGTNAGDRPISILGAEHPQALTGCQIVFLSNLRNVEDARAVFAGRPILTVTYTGSNTNETWCDIELVWLDRRVAFVVDRDALTRKGITFDATLLQVFENAYVRDPQGNMVRTPDRSSGGASTPGS